MKYLENLLGGEYVYIIQDVDISGYYKIGRTKNPTQRMGTFGVQLPFKTEIVRVIPCAESSKVETYLHKHLATKRVNGEWFDLSPRDLIWVLQFHPNEMLPEVDNYEVSARAKYYIRKSRKISKFHENGGYDSFSVGGTNQNVALSTHEGSIQLSWTASNKPEPYGRITNILDGMKNLYESQDCSIHNAERFAAVLIAAIREAKRREKVQEQTA